MGAAMPRPAGAPRAATPSWLTFLGVQVEEVAKFWLEPCQHPLSLVPL